jgi:hypothetical protein
MDEGRLNILEQLTFDHALFIGSFNNFRWILILLPNQLESPAGKLNGKSI